MSLSDADKIVAYIEARVRPTICPTYSSAGKQSIEGRITRDDFDHLIGLVQSLRASQAKVVKALIIARSYVEMTSDETDRHEAAGARHDLALVDSAIALAEHGGQT